MYCLVEILCERVSKKIFCVSAKQCLLLKQFAFCFLTVAELGIHLISDDLLHNISFTYLNLLVWKFYNRIAKNQVCLFV